MYTIAPSTLMTPPSQTKRGNARVAAKINRIRHPIDASTTVEWQGKPACAGFETWFAHSRMATKGVVCTQHLERRVLGSRRGLHPAPGA